MPPALRAQVRDQVRCLLFQLADGSYREFHSGLVPGDDTILGVRIPRLRDLAKKLARKGLTLPAAGSEPGTVISWQDYLAVYLPCGGDLSCGETALCYEERVLAGFVIGYAKMDLPERLRLISAFVPLINSWAVCDTFCGTLKPKERDLPDLWEFLTPYLAQGRDPERRSDPQAEYPVRFAVVMLLSYYIKEDYIDEVLSLLSSIRHQGYYVKMAVAWALSVCYVKFPGPTEALLRDNRMDDFTHNKSIQKILESYRVDQEAKVRLRGMKRGPAK